MRYVPYFFLAALLAGVILATFPASAKLANIKNPKLLEMGFDNCLIFNDGRTDVEAIAHNLQSNGADNFDMENVDEYTIRIHYTMPEGSRWVGEWELYLMVWDEKPKLGVGCVGKLPEDTDALDRTKGLMKEQIRFNQSSYIPGEDA